MKPVPATNGSAYVARDFNRHTSIVINSTFVSRGAKRGMEFVHHIPFDAMSMKVVKVAKTKFGQEYKPFEYSVKQAAQRYLDWQCVLSRTDAAKAALIKLAEGEEVMNDTVEMTGASAPQVATTPKEKEVKKNKAAPNKKAAKKKAATPKKAAKKAAPKEEAPTPKKKKKAKPAVKKAISKSANGAKLGRPFDFELNSKIKKLVGDNPRREGTARWKRFNAYKEGVNISTLLTNPVVTSTGIHMDVEHGFIKIV